MSAAIECSQITISGSLIKNIKGATWHDRDPYVQIEIPAGSIVYQLLKQPLVEGKFSTIDIDDLYNALTGSNSLSGSTGARTKNTMILTYTKSDAGSGSFTFTGFRLDSLDIGDFKEDASQIEYIVNFTAETVAKTQ